MIIHENMNLTLSSKVKKNGGVGFVNTLINKIPFELHIPNYQFCGPGTNLTKRLASNQSGVNPLDQACMLHDLKYSQHQDITNRNLADNMLTKQAWSRFKSKDANLGEKVAALGVAGVMKLKSKLGLGLKRSRKTKKGKGIHKKRKTIKKTKGRGINFKEMVNKARIGLKNKPTTNITDAIKTALKTLKTYKKKGAILKKRIIPIPKSGGFLPLIPIFAALSSLGGIASGAAAITKAINEVKNAKTRLAEAQRHNQTMESIAMGKGFLKPYKQGLGLYLNPYPYYKVSKNSQ